MENPLYYEDTSRRRESNPPKKENRDKNYLIAESLWVNVDYDVYSPDPKRLLKDQLLSSVAENRSKQAILYACGWPNRPKVNPNFHDRFAQELTNRAGMQVFYTDTSVNRIVAGSLEKEAVAMEKMIEEEGLDEVTLMGHSEGAKKVLYLTGKIKERNNRMKGIKPPIKIRGLVLIQAMGLIDQPTDSSLELVMKFVITEGIAAGRAIVAMTKSKRYQNSEKFRDSVARARSEAASAGLVVARSILSDIGQYGVTGYLGFLRNQVQDMIKQAPGIDQIDVPVILVQAKDDVISSREAVIPEYLDKLAFDPIYLQIEETRRQIEQARIDLRPLGGSLRELFKPKVGVHQIREQHIQTTLFKNSPYIRVVVPTHYGVHSITALRPELAVVIDFLKRYERDRMDNG